MKVKYKRLAAYIIDSLIVSFVVGLFASTSLLAKPLEKYNDANNELAKYYTDLLENIDSEDFKIDQSEVEKLVYNVNYYGVPYYSMQVILIILYHVLFQFYNKGQTIGKKLLKIKTVSKDGKELSLADMLLRTVLLYNVVFTIASMILVQFASVKVFTIGMMIINCSQFVVMLVLLFMILFRNDERGLHDLLGSSKVIEDKEGV